MNMNISKGEKSLIIMSPKLTNNMSMNKSHNLLRTSFREKKEHDQQSEEWSPNSQMKLHHVLQYMKRLRDQKRAHNLVMNLPSRMLRSFDKNKFDLLNDKAFYYDEQTYLQLIKQNQNNNLQNHNLNLMPGKQNREMALQSQSLNSSNTRYNNYFEQDSVISNTNTQQRSRKNKQINQILKKNIQDNLIIIKSSFVKMFEQIPVILPSSRLKFTWDLIYMILVVICLFYLPITISFGFLFSDLISQYNLVAIPTLILINIFFKINTGYYRKGQVIVSRIQIIKKYIKQTLLKDIICVFPLIFTLYYQASTYYQQQQQDTEQNSSYFQLILLPFIFKVFSINSTLKKFEERFNLPRFLLNIIQLIKLLFTIVFINHMFACLWLYIAMVEKKYGVDQIWLNYNNKFMSTKNINKKLQYQIREYLEYYWREQAETDYEEKQMIIDQLSDSLRQKLLFEANKIVLRDNQIFKQNFSKTVIEKTVPLILEMKYSPESIICQREVLDDCSIYFIENGSVEIVLNPKGNNQRELIKLKKGESFGSYSFFTGLPRINNIRSCEFTTILKIRREDFLQLLSSYPEDYETFCFIRDQISFLNDYSKIGQVCKGCKSSYHMVNDCQYLHYISNKARIIKFYNDENNIKQSERAPHQRRNPNINYHYKNSLAIQHDVVKQNLIFLEQNESLINFSDNDTEFSDGYYNLESLKGQQSIQRNVLNDVISMKNDFYQITELSTLKEQENESNFNKQVFTKKNTVSKFGQEQNHTTSRSFNTIERNIESAFENITFQDDVQSLNVPDISQQQHYNQNNFPSLDYDSTSRKNLINTSQKKNYDIQYNTINRMRTNTADKSEINYDQNASLIQANQSISSEINNKQGFQQLKLQNSYGNEEVFEKQKKAKVISHQKLKILKDRSQISQELLEKTLSLENKNMQESNGNDKKLKRKQNLIGLNPSEQIAQLLKQVKLLVCQNQQNQINEKKKALQMENEIGQFDIFLNFDKMRQFVKYNPRYNFSSVISRFNWFQDQNNKNIRTKRSQRIKLLTMQMLSKTQFNTQLDSKKLQKNLSSNRQFTNNINELTESKQDSKKHYANSVQQSSDLDNTAQETQSQKLKNFSINNISNDINTQIGTIQQKISQIIQSTITKQQSNKLSFYPNKSDLEQDSINNGEIMSECSFQSKYCINKFNQQQTDVFERLQKDY
ncbi:hypothetical protein ABPG74_020857 [Tetrahymena malaccensis]